MKIGSIAALLVVAAGAGDAAAQCVLVRDGGSMPAVRVESGGPVARFAAEEITRYVAAMSAPGAAAGGADTTRSASSTTSRAKPISTTSGCTITLALDPSLGWDAYRIEVSKTHVSIRGGNERAILFGGYQILKDLGVAFLAPGPLGENVPRKATLSLRTGKRTYTPALRYRGLIVQRPMTEGHLAIADWMAKNQMNYWVNPYWVFDRAEPGLQRRFVEALEKRGILWEYGHHTFARWISRGDHDPDILGLKNGVRTAAAICMVKTKAAERVAESMAAFVAQWPEVDVLSLWPNDSVHGWCECDPCSVMHGDLPTWRGVAPLMTRPYFWFARRVTENLARHGVTQPITALAYKNTIEPVDGIELGDTLRVTVAPIDRNYARRIASLDYFGPVMSEWTDLLGEGSAPMTGARVMAYEYYAGQYPNNSLPMPTVTTLSEDVGDYRLSGFGGITIQAEEGHWGTYVLNFHALARMSFQGPVEPARLIADFSSRYYGAAAGPMTEYWMWQEDLIRSQPNVGGMGQFFHLLRRTEGAIDRLDRLVAQAEGLADSDLVRGRVRFARLNLEYVKLLRDAIEAGRGRFGDTLPPTPKGAGHLSPLASGAAVQIRIPVPVEGGVEFGFGNVVPMTGAGSSYQIEVRRDSVSGPVIHAGAVVSGSADQAALHGPARTWAGSNRVPMDLTHHLDAGARARGFLDLFVTAHVTGDDWTLYRDHDDGGRWDMMAYLRPVSVAEERQIAWERLRAFVEEHAHSGVFNYAPDYVLRVGRQMIEEHR